MKNDNNFAYNLEASRQYQARSSAVISTLPTIPQYPDGIQMPSNDPTPYRQNSAAFTYNSKPYYPVASWAHAIPEEQSIAYPIYGPSYHGLQEPEYSMSYRIGPGAPTKTSPLYVDTEPNYGFSGSSTTSLVHRPAVGESNFTFHNVAAGLTASTAVNDRILPIPVGRTLSSSGASSYRHESTPSTYSKGSQSTTSGTSPTTPNSDVPASYTHYEPPNLSSYPSTTLTTQLSRPNDLYSAMGSSDGVYSTSDSLRTSTSVPDLQYRYTDTTTRKDSTSAAGAITLSHGPTYMSHNPNHQASYILSGDVGGATNTSAATDDHHKALGSLRS